MINSEKYPFKILGVKKFVENELIKVLTNNTFIVFSTLNLPPFKIGFKNMIMN